ncbi:hypothetical protein [Jeotgalibacillus sp. S-D1]|nr:hypothetical protein [Jeotgalibacillus sp. S-D1]
MATPAGHDGKLRLRMAKPGEAQRRPCGKRRLKRSEPVKRG